MKAISLTQPWATLMAIGAKRVETRGWPMLYRGPLAIQASKGFPKECRELVAREPFRSALERAGVTFWRALPLGKVLAIVDVVGCASTEGLKGDDPAAVRCRAEYFDPRPEEWEFGDYSEGRYGILTRNVRLVEPFEAKGALGLWEVDDEKLKPIQRGDA